MQNLKRKKQCAKCPWKKNTDPNDIPNYIREKHINLKNTIAEEGSIESILSNNALRVMACHETPESNEEMCIGWLHNQLGVGNNIALRIQMRDCKLDYELDGEQHESFDETLSEP